MKVQYINGIKVSVQEDTALQMSSGKFFTIIGGTSDPVTDLIEGSFYYRTDTNQLRLYNGSSWLNVDNQTITLTGDVTGSGTGTFATTIAAGVVTLAKMADIATDMFIGRDTAGTGVPEALSIATVKTMLNLAGTNTGDQTITLTGDVTGSGTGSFAATIPAGTVTLAKMADIATDMFIGRDTAGTGVPEALSIATVKTMLDLAGTNSGDQTSIVGITGSLAEFNAALTGADFATGGGTATGTNTGDQTITLTGDVTGSGTGSFAATIPAGTVTLAKMADIATDMFIGRDTAGTGVPEALSIATVRTMLSINNVDNTSDANKPVSTATQTALDLKENLSYTFVTDSTTARTLGASDNGKVILFTNAGAIALTVPDTLSVGFRCIIKQATGAGAVTVSGSGTMTIESRGNLYITNGAKAVASLFVESSTVTALYGDLV